MKINLSEKDIKTLKIVSQVAGAFTVVVAITMIFSFIQLKSINPLDNPALLSIKEQYDSDPANQAYAEQVRAMDLMARKAYFSSRWQVETGSYLLILGAVIFFLCERLVTGSMKPAPTFPGPRATEKTRKEKSRRWLMISAAAVSVIALASSFLIREEMPDTGSGRSGKGFAAEVEVPEPDKTNFPSFRGAGSQGIAGGSGYPVEWNGESGKNILWKVGVPGAGKSSPVIWGNNLYITGSADTVCEVYCYDKRSGKIGWTARLPELPGEPSQLPEMDQDAGLATPSVAANDDFVCAIFANGNLICLDHKGKTVWARNIGVPASVYGYSSSLLITGNLLIVQFDSDSKISLLGLELETGNKIWETIRKGRPVWSSPVLARLDGQVQVIINGNPDVTGFDAATGKELWSVECMSGDVAPSVAVNDSLVFAETNYAKLAAVEPGKNSIRWEDNSVLSDVSSPVAAGMYLFMAGSAGELICYNSLKGDTLWMRFMPETYYASPVVADEKVYFLDRSGVTTVVEADSVYKMVSRSPLGERADCTPAFSDRKIYIRGKNNLYCIAEN